MSISGKGPFRETGRWPVLPYKNRLTSEQQAAARVASYDAEVRRKHAEQARQKSLRAHEENRARWSRLQDGTFFDLQNYRFDPMPKDEELSSLLRRWGTLDLRELGTVPKDYPDYRQIMKEVGGVLALALMTDHKFSFPDSSAEHPSFFDCIDAVTKMEKGHFRNAAAQKLLPQVQATLKTMHPFVKGRHAEVIPAGALKPLLSRAEIFDITDKMKTDYPHNFRNPRDVPYGHELPTRVKDAMLWRKLRHDFEAEIRCDSAVPHLFAQAVRTGVQVARAVASGVHQPREIMGNPMYHYDDHCVPKGGLVDPRLRRRGLRLLAKALFGIVRNGDQMNAIWQATGVVPNQEVWSAVADRAPDEIKGICDAHQSRFIRQGGNLASDIYWSSRPCC